MHFGEDATRWEPAVSGESVGHATACGHDAYGGEE